MTEDDYNDRLTILKEQIRVIDAEIAELEDERADAERELRRVRIEEYDQRAESSTLSDMRGDMLAMVEAADDVGVYRQQLITYLARDYNHVSAAEDAENILEALLREGELYEVDGNIKRT